MDGKRTLYDICTQGPHSAAENAKVLYAFQILQLIRGAAAVAAGSAGAAARRRPTGAIKIRFKTQGDKFSA